MVVKLTWNEVVEALKEHAIEQLPYPNYKNEKELKDYENTCITRSVGNDKRRISDVV